MLADDLSIWPRPTVTTASVSGLRQFFLSIRQFFKIYFLNLYNDPAQPGHEVKPQTWLIQVCTVSEAKLWRGADVKAVYTPVQQRDIMNPSIPFQIQVTPKKTTPNVNEQFDGACGAFLSKLITFRRYICNILVVYVVQ